MTDVNEREWLAYGVRKKLNYMILSYLASYPGTLHNPDKKLTPKNWERLALVLDTANISDFTQATEKMEDFKVLVNTFILDKVEAEAFIRFVNLASGNGKEDDEVLFTRNITRKDVVEFLKTRDGVELTDENIEKAVKMVKESTEEWFKESQYNFLKEIANSL